MSARGAIERGRRLAESLMTTQVEIKRVLDVTTDPETGKDIPSYSPVLYPDPAWPADHPWSDGRAKLTSYEGYEQTPVVGGHESTVQRMALHLPVGALVMRPGDIATVVDSTDPRLVGRRLRLLQVAPYKEHATADRIFVEEVTS